MRRTRPDLPGRTVLLTSSCEAFGNGMVNAPHAGSKAAVEALRRSLRSEPAGTGATAGALSPLLDFGIDHHRRVQRLVRELEDDRRARR
ncbi:MAG: hypothetical protein PGN13_14895 [Patulibacter minatonensis]